MWSRAFPIYKRIKDEITSGALGDIQMVTATLAKLVLKPTFHDKATGGGTMMAFGMYPIQFANWVFNNEKPEKIIATSSLSETGIYVHLLLWKIKYVCFKLSQKITIL